MICYYLQKRRLLSLDYASEITQLHRGPTSVLKMEALKSQVAPPGACGEGHTVSHLELLQETASQGPQRMSWDGTSQHKVCMCDPSYCPYHCPWREGIKSSLSKLASVINVQYKFIYIFNNILMNE